ncbi:hypothetical protein Micbo1qcDRAFT_181428 [Microdochium bolleyi]|uniref:F-box domain-containing protein n=1 Tax=Microdochium bolleyi TaxID=196109 RepID=A0A136IIC1_9PEZI|nr:hypothetical protein Micbo1qcDRAFT_181428 [Microdochium bolleyi]
MPPLLRLPAELLRHVIAEAHPDDLESLLLTYMHVFHSGSSLIAEHNTYKKLFRHIRVTTQAGPDILAAADLADYLIFIARHPRAAKHIVHLLLYSGFSAALSSGLFSSGCIGFIGAVAAALGFGRARIVKMRAMDSIVGSSLVEVWHEIQTGVLRSSVGNDVPVSIGIMTERTSGEMSCLTGAVV